MKTLLFCTSYMAGAADWDGRYRAWLRHVAAIPVERDAVCMFDDGSPFVPTDAEVVPVTALPGLLDGRPLLYRCGERLGRDGINHFPGWLRSFFFSLTFARRYGFGKIVHLESDARILSGRMASYVDSLDSGWSAFWCPAYKMPETAIQVICADRFDEMAAFARDPLAALEGYTIELGLPFTNIETTLAGDRYGEFGLVPPADADYACQFDWREEAVFRAAPVADAAGGDATQAATALSGVPVLRRLIGRLFGR